MAQGCLKMRGNQMRGGDLKIEKKKKKRKNRISISKSEQKKESGMSG